MLLYSQRFNTDLEKGLTTAAVAAGHKAHGFNTLTPPPRTSEWIKFGKTLFGGFALLLWSGAFLCLFAYAIQVAQEEDPLTDNLWLGIVLAAVVVVTGVFSYYQENKSSRIMDSFKKMMPQVLLITLRQI